MKYSTGQSSCQAAPAFAEEAERLLRLHGWVCIPLGARKQPAVPWKRYQTYRPDPEEARALFLGPLQGNLTGLALICGYVSGNVAVLDYDVPGEYRAWARRHPELARMLPTSRTGRGFQVFCRVPPAFLVFLPTPWGEVRADSGHYCVLPPSLHPSGKTYAWLVEPGNEIPMIPDPVAAGLYPSSFSCPLSVPPSPPSSPKRSCSSPYTSQGEDNPEELERIMRRTLPTGPGQRHACLFALARELRGFLGKADEATLEPILRDWWQRCRPVVREKRWSATWREFRSGWERVRQPVGASLAALASWLAERFPVDPWGGDEAMRQQYLLRLEVGCQLLRAQWGGGSFPLGEDTAGRLVGASDSTGRRLLLHLEKVGILERTGEADRLRRKAREWAYLGPSFSGTLPLS